MSQIGGAVLVNESATFTTTSATITAATPGNILTLFIVSQRSPAARTVSSLSCTNVTWSLITSRASGVLDVEMWLGVVSGGLSGTTVTITMSGTGATICGEVDEWRMTASTAAGGVSLTNTNTAPTSGTFTPAALDLVLVCEGHANGTAPTATPGGLYQDLQGNANSTVCFLKAAYQLAALPNVNTVAAVWTITSALWISVCAVIVVTPAPLMFENYKTGFQAGDGMSVTEKIR